MPAYNLAKRIMPKISDTERAALDSGTIAFDRDLFTGNPPTVTDLVNKYKVSLTPEETSFLQNETEVLCEMLDSYQIDKDQNLPPKVWQYIRENKFMGIVISKAFGGLGFSAHAHAKIVEKIAGRNGAAAVTVMVPNSLGPGELLYHYGTPEQKAYYLPRLAHGIDIPCFGLTGPANGSDAASMRDEGVVCKENGVLGMRVTFNKRYITLGPVATVVGLAFKLRDPEKLLTKGKEGITVALLPKEKNQFAPNGLPGLLTGNRHDPLGAAFMNGTVQGQSVFIPMTCVIGGEERTGFGWNMLMECLGEGRGISLPALGVASSKMATLAVGGYARVRKQFKVPIAAMEGVQEKLAVIGGNAFTVTAAQHFFNAILADKQKPPVLSAIMKLHCTERARQTVNEAMDIVGGAGISKGPANFMHSAYIGLPIAITVEGANVLTRTLISFGQGLTRSHPHLLNLVEAIRNGNDLAGFNRELKNIIVHAFKNLGRSLTRFASVQFSSKSDVAAYYEAQLQRLAADFAFASDVGLTLGGGLKTAEFLSGRYSDVLSNLYLGYACLWFHAQNRGVKGIDSVLDLAMSRILVDAQDGLFGIYRNFPVPLLGPLMQLVTFPRGREYHPASDKLRGKVSDLMTTPTEVRAFLTENVFVSKNPNDRVNQIARAVSLAVEADRVMAACRKERREPTKEEAAKIDAAEALREQIIQVDSFPMLADKPHNDQWMKPTWTIKPIDPAALKAAAAAHH